MKLFTVWGVALLLVSGIVRAQGPDNEWTVELGSGVLFSNVRTGEDSDTLLPIDVTLSLQLDDVSGDDFCGGIFRGYSEFFFRSMNMVYLHGYENHMNGMALGPRYNFVQPGWKIVPFVEGGVGFGFADSQGITEGGRQRGLGQDFNFMFSVAGGATYDFARDWFARLAFFYAHFSNAGQSQPERANNSIDAVGPELSFGYRF